MFLIFLYLKKSLNIPLSIYISLNCKKVVKKKINTTFKSFFQNKNAQCGWKEYCLEVKRVTASDLFITSCPNKQADLEQIVSSLEPQKRGYPGFLEMQVFDHTSPPSITIRWLGSIPRGFLIAECRDF